MSKSVIVKKISKRSKNHSSKSNNITKIASPSYSGSATAAVMEGNGFVMPQVMPRAKSRPQAKEPLGKRILAHLRRFTLDKADETAFFEPKTWAFWRGIIMYFFIFSVVGHWMEIPYCMSMHALFGIVEPDYAIWEDPLYVPYWVYGVGAAIITLMLMPLKIKLVGKRKTMWGAALEFFVISVVLCAAMECIMGWIINQPNEFGKYPYWDNSVLPLNIFDQAWLVNDVFLGLVSLAYVWFVFPFCQKACRLIGERASNRVFGCVLVLFGFICVVTYGPAIVGLG